MTLCHVLILCCIALYCAVCSTRYSSLSSIILVPLHDITVHSIPLPCILEAQQSCRVKRYAGPQKPIRGQVAKRTQQLTRNQQTTTSTHALDMKRASRCQVALGTGAMPCFMTCSSKAFRSLWQLLGLEYHNNSPPSPPWQASVRGLFVG